MKYRALVLREDQIEMLRGLVDLGARHIGAQVSQGGFGVVTDAMQRLADLYRLQEEFDRYATKEVETPADASPSSPEPEAAPAEAGGA